MVSNRHLVLLLMRVCVRLMRKLDIWLHCLMDTLLLRHPMSRDSSPIPFMLISGFRIEVSVRGCISLQGNVYSILRPVPLLFFEALKITLLTNAFDGLWEKMSSLVLLSTLLLFWLVVGLLLFACGWRVAY